MDSTFDPTKPSVPISFPIKNLRDLESRSYFNSFHYPFNIASVPLPSYAYLLPSRPRILVCHDMEGGYQDDRWVQGGSNEGAYAIWHWYLMDVFVYFSHYVVTIPPPCWINAAHTHGVKVLGTFITEGDEGRVVANELLSTKESAKMYAELLAELASVVGFDGWLINMEIKLDKWQVPIMEEFVSHLTQTMHSSVPGSLVIWYDSVTKDGNLSWQDQLNDNNKPFFNLCDGIFVNYTWQASYPKISAAVAGERKFDVYMGIDVFGRNTFGGGEWNTNVALDVLKKDNVSAAIFAPGWLYEKNQPPDFQTAQNRWWDLIEKSWGILRYYPKALPFYSNFDQGHGYHFSVEGFEVVDGPWNNISCQNFQPVLDNSLHSSQTPIQVSINFKDKSYSGGAGITFKGSLGSNSIFTTRIFLGELTLGDRPIHISYSVRSDGNSLLGLSLGFSSNSNGRTTILLAADGQTCLSEQFSEIITPSQIKKAETESKVPQEWILNETSIRMNGYTLNEINTVCYLKGKADVTEPTRKQGQESGKSYRISSSSSVFDASLGHISIQNSDQNIEFPPATEWITEGQDITWATKSDGTKTVSLKITWKLKAGDTSSFLNYNIYVEKLDKGTDNDPSYPTTVSNGFIGVTRSNLFYISDLEVPGGITSIRFLVQVCGLDGTCQKLEESPAFNLNCWG